MKKFSVRIISLLLTLGLLLSLVAVSVSAAGIQYNDVEDFSAATVDATTKEVISDTGWTGKVESGKVAPDSVSVEGEVFSQTFSTSGMSIYQIWAPEKYAGETDYRFTGSFLCEGRGSSYYCLMLCADISNGNAWKNNAILKINTSGSFQVYTNDDGTATATAATAVTNSDTVANAAYIGGWVDFEFVRQGTEFVATFRPQAENAPVITQRISLTTVGSTAIPGIRLQAGGVMSTKTATVKVDNLRIGVRTDETEEGALFSRQELVYEDFTNAKLSNASIIDTQTSDWTSHIEGGNNQVSIANGAFTYKSIAGARYCLYAPERFVSNNFTFSGDIHVASNVSDGGYFTVMLRSTSVNNGGAARIYVNKNSFQIGFLNDAANNIAVNETISSNQESYVGKTLQFSFERRGAEESFTVWVKGNRKATEKNVTYTLNNETAATPSLRLQADTTTAVAVTLDNLCVSTNTVGDVMPVGVQLSREAANDANDHSFSVRFIAAVDGLDYQKVGFYVSAKTLDGVQRQWTLHTETVYDTIIGVGDMGSETYTANSLGGRYLIALTIAEIPKSVGEVSFEICTYGIDGEGEKTYYSDVATTRVRIKDDQTVEVLPTQVTPQMFGAKGDGQTDDSAAMAQAIAYASQNNVPLVLPEAVYYCLEVTTLENITVQSQNATVYYMGLERNVPAVDLKNNVSVYGTLNVYAYDNVTNNGIISHGGRCGVGVGNYNTGAGYSNIYLEHVVVTGGIPGGNAVFVTGDSHDVTIDRITVPSGTKYARAFLAHWGNADDHGPEYVNGEKTGYYLHKDNWKPSKHPHDIHLGVVDCQDFVTQEGEVEGDKAAVTLSAAYNVTVDEIIVDNSKFAIAAIAGDMGFAYAEDEIKAIGQKNLKVEKITATNMRSAAIYVTSQSGYKDKNSTQVFDAHIELSVTTANISMKSGYNDPAVAVHAAERVDIGTLNVTAASTAMDIRNGCQNVTIDSMNISNCTGDVVRIALKAPAAETCPQNVTIRTLKLTNCGSSSANAICVWQVNGLKVENVILSGCTYKSVLYLYDDAVDVRVDSITASSTTISSIIYAKETITSANQISIGSYPKNYTLKKGSSCVITTGN